MKTASIFGASGATGQELLGILLSASEYSKVKIFGRTKLGLEHPKLEQFVADFDQLPAYRNEIQADDIFVCVGTTQKKAGSKENFRKVDFDIPTTLSDLVDKNAINSFIVISSIGASAQSMNFYLRTKGQMEEYVLKKIPGKAKVLRPSLLLGKRNEFRFLEEVSKIFYSLFSVFMIGTLKKYRPIGVKDVAFVMFKIANNSFDNSVFESNIISQMSK